jgi:hypothetical protein
LQPARRHARRAYFFFEAAFRELDFFAVDFFAVLFFAPDFLAGDFLAVDLRDELELFFAALFLAFGFGGMFAPDRRASLKPMAMACFGFFTFPPRPRSSSWCLNSCMTFSILLWTIRFDFGSDPEEDFLEVPFFFVAIYKPRIYSYCFTTKTLETRSTEMVSLNAFACCSKANESGHLALPRLLS